MGWFLKPGCGVGGSLGVYLVQDVGNSGKKDVGTANVEQTAMDICGFEYLLIYFV